MNYGLKSLGKPLRHVRPMWYLSPMSKTFSHSKGNREMMKAVQELRRSSASAPHKNKKAYSRKAKHRSLEINS